MSRIDHVQRVLNDIGVEICGRELPLDEHGRHLTDINGIDVTFLYSREPAETVWLFADIIDVPGDADQLRGLLQHGFATWVSSQMTLGVDQSGKRVVGFTTIPVVMLTADILKEGLVSLLSAAATLIDRLERGECRAYGKTASGGEGSPSGVFWA